MVPVWLRMQKHRLPHQYSYELSAQSRQWVSRPTICVHKWITREIGDEIVQGFGTSKIQACPAVAEVRIDYPADGSALVTVAQQDISSGHSRLPTTVSISVQPLREVAPCYVVPYAMRIKHLVKILLLREGLRVTTRSVIHDLMDWHRDINRQSPHDRLVARSFRSFSTGHLPAQIFSPRLSHSSAGSDAKAALGNRPWKLSGAQVCFTQAAPRSDCWAELFEPHHRGWILGRSTKALYGRTVVTITYVEGAFIRINTVLQCYLSL